MFAVAVILLVVGLALKLAPKDKHQEPSSTNAHIQTAGQIGLLGAFALFGVDYFSSFFYATGEMMHVLHPLGLQGYAWIPVIVVVLINLIFGGLYIYSLGPFNEGGGSYTASMRYLLPAISLIVAVTLLEDYIMTVVVSALSGADQFLSITGQFAAPWLFHFIIAALLAGATWFFTIRGRGESSKAVFTLLIVFFILTIFMAVGLIHALVTGSVAPAPNVVEGATSTVSIGSALFALLGASMKGIVALTGLEAMSNGIQFVQEEDAGVIKWAKRKFPKYHNLWKFYSGKVGIGRLVQSSFLFYGGLTTLFAVFFAVHFNVFDGTNGRTLIGNLASIGFSLFPNGNIFFGAYQLLSVLLLAAASMTAFQDTQATAWRDVAIGEIPEFICHRDKKGTFTRSVTATFGISLLIMFLVQGNTSRAIPFYGVGVFLPIMIMGLAIRQHILQTVDDVRKRQLGSMVAGLAAVIAGIVFISQLFARWEEGGWLVLVSFSILFTGAHLILISRYGRRTPEHITYIVREKARVQGAMASIVEWQSLRMQQYRYHMREKLMPLMAALGYQMRLEPRPAEAGPYNPHLHAN